MANLWLIQKIRQHGLRVFPVALKHFAAFVYHRDRLLCFGIETEVVSGVEPDYCLREIDRGDVAEAILQYQDDTSTAEFLERAEEKLAGGTAKGYALCSADAKFLNFGWVLPCDGYHVEELGIHLEGRRLLIFDCYTPVQHRRKHYYCTALKLVIKQYQERKNELLIFCSDRNTASVRGILKAGFVERCAFESTIIFGRPHGTPHASY